ncbi:MAG: hypothetical protein AAF727_06700 [Pseudomonadota bacterium]
MTMNNKILTVSYGTFSCTLEGFDDSFGTMKAIAEYFRDLASDDRYFGAEPPQPDAEMLTRIAEREISRRVQAREHDGRIVLSASDAHAEADTAPTPVADAVVTTAPAALAAAAGVAAAQTAPAAAPVDTADTEAQDAPAAGDAKIVAPNDTPDDAVDTSDAVDATSDDVTSAPEVAEEDEQREDTPIAETAVDTDPDPAEADMTEDSSEDDLIAEPVAATPAEADLPADSIAAKLQRIRAVVSKSQQDADEDELFEDEHADAMTPAASDPQDEDDYEETASSDDVIADAARDIEEAFGADDAALAHELAQEDEDEDLAAMLRRLDASTPSDDAADPKADTTEATNPQADVVDDYDDDLGIDSIAALVAADASTDVAADDREDDNMFDAAANGDLGEAEGDADAPSPRRARVIKVKRADIDAALASGQLEQVEDDTEADDAETGETTLSDEEEAELMAELAQVEAEMPSAQDASVDDADAQATVDEDALEQVESDDGQDDAVTAGGNDDADLSAQDADTDDVAETEADAEVDATAEAEAGDQPEPSEAEASEDDAIAARTRTQHPVDGDVSRLMAEAENQMEEPEGSSRRDAFAQLKAAVKAKKADADIGSDSIEDEGAFRSDLAEVVRPRRPEASTSRADRPENARPAPLKLVAEQRVDINTAAQGPVRPRRVAAPQEVAQDAQGADSFADYVAELGAHDLPALLEAAASYLSFVEGRDQFSRPQLMTKVRQEKDDFSREDGLRSFGQLLRAGKIEKISGGRFAVTSDIGYRPEQRAAG